MPAPISPLVSGLWLAEVMMHNTADLIRERQTTRRLECFIRCSCLVISRPKLTDPNTFAVVLQRNEEDGPSEEIARTEICRSSSSPSWTTSISVEHTINASDSRTLRIDVYNSDSEGSPSLLDNTVIGRASFRVESVARSPGLSLVTHLRHPSRGEDIVGVLQVDAEPETESPTRDEIIEIDLLSSMLNRREWPFKGLPQSFEIWRAHHREDASGMVAWLPIYRSDRLGPGKEYTNYLEFSRVTTTKRHLCNGDEERDIRVLFYSRVSEITAKRKSVLNKPGELELGYVEFTLRDLYEVDPTGEVFKIESLDSDEIDIGYMSLLHAEPTDVGSHFVLQFDHAPTSKYSSASWEDHARSSRRVCNESPQSKASPGIRVCRGFARRVGKRSASRGEIRNAAHNIQGNNSARTTHTPSLGMDIAGQQDASTFIKALSKVCSSSDYDRFPAVNREHKQSRTEP